MTDPILEIVNGLHATLAAFATESYARAGRGVVYLSLPAVPAAGATVSGRTDLVYHAIDDLLSRTAGLVAAANADAETLLRMAQTYDPETQAVVMVVCSGQAPTTVKMRLNPPTLVEEAGGVH